MDQLGCTFIQLAYNTSKHAHFQFQTPPACHPLLPSKMPGTLQNLIIGPPIAGTSTSRHWIRLPSVARSQVSGRKSSAAPLTWKSCSVTSTPSVGAAVKCRQVFWLFSYCNFLELDIMWHTSLNYGKFRDTAMQNTDCRKHRVRIGAHRWRSL